MSEDHRRVLVTGAVGLVGRGLVAALREAGLAVRGVDRASPDGILPADTEFVLGDLRDEYIGAAALEGVSAVVHCAAVQYQSRPHAWRRRSFFAQNVEATRTLVQACRAADVRQLVMLSSDMVYGTPHGRSFTEGDPPRPIGPYGRSKLACEQVCQELADGGTVVTILRPRLIIGPGRVGVLAPLFERVRGHRRIPLLGDGTNRYQMVAVADVVDACLRALRVGQRGVFNLGSEAPPSVGELLTGLMARAGSRSRLVRLPAAAARCGLTLLDWLGMSPLAPEQFRIASRDYVLATERARAALGWSPKLSDADMLWAAYEAYLKSCGIGVVEVRCSVGRCAGAACPTFGTARCERAGSIGGATAEDSGVAKLPGTAAGGMSATS